MILLLLGVIIICHLLLLSRLIFLPYPELFVYPYLTNQGLLPYKQILDQHFPGLLFLPINLDNLSFHTPQEARVWQYGLVIIIQLLIYVTSKKYFKNNFQALLCCFFYLIWQPFFEGWVLWIDSFLPVFYLASFYLIMHGIESKNVKKYLYAGLMLGLATIFKQVAIPLFILVSLYFLYIKRYKELKYLIIGYIPLPSLMVLFFILKGTFSDFWYFTVIYNLTTFAQLGRKFAKSGEIVRASLVFVPAIMGFFLSKKTQKVYLALFFMLGGLTAAFARFDFIHLQPALPFAILLMVGFVKSNKSVFLKAILIIFILASIYFLRNFYKTHLGTRIYFYEENIIRTSEKIKELTTPGEKIFIFGASPHLYQITNTMPAGNLFVFQFPWFIKETQSKILNGIKKDSPKIIVADRSVTIQGEKISDYMREVDMYILSNYKEIDSVAETVILEKK